MRKLIIALVSVAGFVLVPVAAQAAPTGRPAPAHVQRVSKVNDATLLRVRIATLDRRIDAARTRGQLTRGELRTLGAEMKQIDKTFARLSRKGLTRAEVATMDRLLDRAERSFAKATGRNGRRA